MMVQMLSRREPPKNYRGGGTKEGLAQVSRILHHRRGDSGARPALPRIKKHPSAAESWKKKKGAMSPLLRGEARTGREKKREELFHLDKSSVNRVQEKGRGRRKREIFVKYLHEGKGRKRGIGRKKRFWGR